jgi:hypothetical protein
VNRRALLPYLAAIALVLLAWGFQALIGHLFGEVFAFVPFLVAAMLVSWIGGLRATLFAMLLGLCSDFLFLC